MSNYKNAVAAYINYLKFFSSDEYTSRRFLDKSIYFAKRFAKDNEGNVCVPDYMVICECVRDEAKEFMNS